MKIFRKLVRDNMPEIMASQGKHLKTRILDDAEFLTALENKLLEEVQELREERMNKKDKVAYIHEILDTYMSAQKFSRDEIEKIQSEQNRTKGGFAKKLFLEGEE